MRWDVFCRVIDNHGDLGVCWRLAADLGRRGHAVRLWVDDARALAWMAPPAERQGLPVEVIEWRADTPAPEPGDVVVEAFACDPPAGFVRRMRRARPPVWINLEYLSAEAWVERCHGLRSPQLAGPGAGLDKWFFHPGFGVGTGGLLREPDLDGRRRGFDAQAWRAAHGIDAAPGTRVASLFCYDNPGTGPLLDALSRAAAPVLLLATPGPAQAQVRSWQQARGHAVPGPAGGIAGSVGALRVQALPWLGQRDYDELLWSCDLNFVRGEDSFVRAQWAGRPFVWQIYPQHDGAHVAKLEAFLDRHLAGASPGLACDVRALWRDWNGLGDGAALAALAAGRPPAGDWQAACEAWRNRLAALPDLTTALLGFVAGKG